MYKCLNCDFISPIDYPTCKSCGEVNTFEKVNEVEEIKVKKDLPQRYVHGAQTSKKFERLSFKDYSLNDLFGGWLTKGSVNFFSAEPGAWKSTFLWQLGELLEEEVNIVYFSGEENETQVYDRLKRLYGDSDRINNISLYYGDDVEILLGIIQRDKPDIVIIDSINSFSWESYSKQAEITRQVTKMLKTLNITWFIIGHINKSWEISGKKTLEHEVDGVFMLSGQESRTDSIRILKVLKMRFWTTNNVVVMKMWERGFTVINPKKAFEIFVEESPDSAGSVFCPVLEWNQLFLLEIQSLITTSSYSNPINVAIGINKQSLSIILATLTKVTKFQSFKEDDVFVKFIWPDLVNTKVDLAVAMSLISSQLNKNLKQYIFIGAMWLAGEIRSIPRQNEIKDLLVKHGYKEENIITRERFKNIIEIIKFINK